jgi:hypothetical protein
MMQAPVVVTSWPALVGVVTITVLGNAAILGIIAKAVFDRMVMQALMRCKPELREIVNDLYATELKAIEAIGEDVDTNKQRLAFIDAQVAEQGRMHREQTANQYAQTARTLESMTTTLVEIQKEAKATAVAVARLEVVAEMWDGTTERRKARRTRGDGQ